MSAKLERLAWKLRRTGHSHLAQSVDFLANLTIKLGVPESFSVVKEKFPRRDSFTQEERRILEEDRYLIYRLDGKKVKRQPGVQNPFWDGIKNGKKFLNLPSIRGEVAISSDPKQVFVPNTGGRNLDVQENLLKQDAAKLRQRLKLEEIDEIIPDEASTFIELALKHLKETGAHLFLSEENEHFACVTKNYTKKDSSRVAIVFNSIDLPLAALDWSRSSGNYQLFAVRLIVPISGKK